MITINYTRTEKVEGEFLYLATILGYTETLENKIEAEITVEEANANNYKIKEVLEDNTKCIAITGTETIANPQSIKEFLEEKMSEIITSYASQKVLEARKKELEEKRRLEDEAIEQQVKELVGETEIIV